MTIAVVLAVGLAVANADPRPDVLIVVGAPGSPEYGKMFGEWADRWQAAGEKGGASVARIGGSEHETEDRERIRTYLSAGTITKNPAPLWVVLIGHGTYDGRTARFNLTGPDVSAEELAEWLTPLARPVAVVNCASASGPFLNAVSGPNRVIVTAARSGHETNFARFGEYISAAIADPNADLDKDDQVSLLEAYLVASGRVTEFYTAESRLATEHSLLDDNGDQLGTPADWFTGVRATQQPKGTARTDGPFAHQFHLVPSERERAIPPAVRERRDELERQLAALRDQKPELAADEYYRRLEPVLIELAELYRDHEPTPGR